MVRTRRGGFPKRNRSVSLARQHPRVFDQIDFGRVDQRVDRITTARITVYYHPALLPLFHGLALDSSFGYIRVLSQRRENRTEQRRVVLHAAPPTTAIIGRPG